MAINYCLLSVIALWSLSGVLCDVNVSDYLFWKKADIEAWHEFFPNRAIEEERQTNVAAQEAVAAMDYNLNSSLTRVLAFQEKEQQTAIQMMTGTPAEGCIKGISDFISTSINSAKDNYADCTADAPSKLVRLNATWTRYRNAYVSSYQRAMSGVDACAATYPNRNQFDRLQSCVDSMINNYLKTAQATQAAMFPSPSMNYFKSQTLECLRDAVNDVVAKGRQFLGMLVDCAALIEDKRELEMYKYELSQWEGYDDDLVEQVTAAQTLSYYKVQDVERSMRSYYIQEKVSLEKSVVETRGLSYYQSIVFKIMDDYYNTITATALDNPGDASCVTAARASLDGYAAIAANASLSCDVDMVSRTKQLIANVFSKFRELNQKMPYIGSPALLKCFSKGYIYAPGTISSCFNLTFTSFDIDYSDRRTSILNDTAALYAFQTSFTSGGLPCGGSSLDRLKLAGQIVLYELQRCLYSNFGTKYDVTTPTPLTTSVAPTTAMPTTTTTPGVPS